MLEVERGRMGVVLWRRERTCDERDEVADVFVHIYVGRTSLSHPLIVNVRKRTRETRKRTVHLLTLEIHVLPVQIRSAPAPSL